MVCAIGQFEKPIRQPRALIHSDSLELVTKGRNNVIKMDDHEISLPEHSDSYIYIDHTLHMLEILHSFVESGSHTNQL